MISIITPTYNRSYILPNLYTSLLNQTSTNFEWIVIDDGSKDDTKQLFKEWEKNNNGFSIKYVEKENGGKHTAINLGVKLADFDYIFIVDSDDRLIPTAVTDIIEWLETISDRNDFVGVAGLKGHKNGVVIGSFPKNKVYVDATNLERKRNKLIGDKAEVLRKDILLENPFPEIAGENFISEGVVWNEIAAQGYKIRWFNKVIYIGDYLEDGLTRSKPFELELKNFIGYTLYQKAEVANRSFPYNFVSLGIYIEVARKKGLSLKEIKNEMEISTAKLLCGIILGKSRGLKEWLKGKLKKSSRNA